MGNEIRQSAEARQRSAHLARAGFILALALFFYGTLFPFTWHFGHHHTSRAWARADLLPFWDAERGRIHSLPDIASNILLAAPIGFFGFLQRRRGGAWRWGTVTLILGAVVEVLQLGIPGRTTSLTDVFSLAIGGAAGAAAAKACGTELLDLLVGGVKGPVHRWLLIMLAVILISKLGPFDLTLDVSSLRGDARAFWKDPWELKRPPRDEWNSMAQFVLLGALAGSLRKSGELPYRICPAMGIATLFAAPWILEGAQLFVLSHTPSLRDGAMDTTGAALGWIMGLYLPALLRPQVGLSIVSLGVLAAGLSPYRLSARPTSFGWVPLAEYYRQTTPAALYDAGMSIVNYALIGALLRQSCRRRRCLIVVAAAGFAAAIEAAQMFVADRHPGITDAITASLGAWIGATLGEIQGSAEPNLHPSA